MINLLIIAALLLVLELVYFKIADRFNIIDKPNERSSHSSIVLRGGGVIFSLSMLAWAVMMVIQGDWQVVSGYLPFLIGLLLVAGVSFWDDVRSLPDSVRLVVQTGDVTYQIFLLVYGVDGCLTICHRILLHENLRELKKS